MLFYFLLVVLIGSLAAWGIFYYYSKTKAIPKYGGEYIEGIVGQPMHLNPLLSQSNDTDADLSRIIYSSLFKYDGKGQLIPDLAESYDISDDKTVYTIHLKQNVLWHDSQNFKVDDVIFTTQLISDSNYKSPLRRNWQGVQINKIDDYTIEFKIETPYTGFLSNLTFGILPKHIWESISPESFSLSPLNLEPIGTGPYKYNSIQKDSKGNVISYKLISHPGYFEGRPYISKLTFNFYTDDISALDALNRKEIMGINALTAQKIGDIKTQKSVFVRKFSLPNYFAVFLNQTKSISIADDAVRKALAYATDRQEIIDTVFMGNAQPVYFPFLPNMIGYSADLEHPEFNLDEANKILNEAGWIKGENGFRTKGDAGLEINLVTTDWNELVKTAQIIKTQWEKAGIKVNINSSSFSDVQQNFIRPREYEALLFGQKIGADPDPYPFWHSSQKKDPYSNLALFDNGDADKLIEAGRIEFDADKRAQEYIDFQKILNQENPAVFLYSSNYLYPINKKVQGISAENLISPSDRFSDVNHWYIKTKRVKK